MDQNTSKHVRTLLRKCSVAYAVGLIIVKEYESLKIIDDVVYDEVSTNDEEDELKTRKKTALSFAIDLVSKNDKCSENT